MPIEAPLSKFKRTNLKIYIFVCVLGAVVFAYDGYLSGYDWSHRKSFHEEHVVDGVADDYMEFNRKAPIFFAIAAVAFLVRFGMVKNKKIIADENELVMSCGEKISYDSIEAIDKTHFDSKGYFIIAYKKEGGVEKTLRISDKKYDNLGALLDELVAKIS